MDRSRGGSPSPTDMPELDRWVSYYYEVGTPEKARDVLEALCRQGSELGSHLVLFFARIARGRPEVVRDFEDLFAQPDLPGPARLFILSVLRLAADDDTLGFLETCAEDEAFSAESDQIRGAVDQPLRVPLDLLALPIESPDDLDRVWAEFHVSGEPAAVRRIIDVLERPDRVREQLDAYLASPPRGWIRRWLRGRALNKLGDRGLYLEPGRGAVASVQDLDCFCSTRGFDPSEEEWDAYRRLLPFLAEKPPVEVMVKAVARWSLARNAAQHERVLETCREEAERRVGRARLTLLEIVALTGAARRDLASAFQALRASLDPDPGARARIESELAEVMDLPWRPVEAQRFSTRAAEVTLAACLDATKLASSYSSRLEVHGSRNAAGAAGAAYWRLDVVRPDKYRVLRSGGSDMDEWVTVGVHHFRGPAFLRLDGAGSEASERRETRWLLLEKYLAIVRSAEPVAVEERDGAGTRYHVVEYGPEILASMLGSGGGPFAPARSESGGGGGPLRIWMDAETKMLVRAEWEIAEDGTDGTPRPCRLVQGFAGYDRAPAIAPPPFQLVKAVDS